MNDPTRAQAADEAQDPGKEARQAPGWLAGGMLGLFLVLMLKRYAGINHDAVLYMGQGFARRWPEIFSHDLAFMHGGGQERFTLFPRLLDLALQQWNPATVFMWGALFSTLAFAAASWAALGAIRDRTPRFWAWIAVLCLPTGYGFVEIFRYNEPFLTPRPLAEALCLLGIGLMVARKHAWSVVALVAAGLLHPLQTIAVAPLLWCFLIRRDWRWLHLAWIAALGGAAGWLARGWLPMHPFQVIDPAWLALLKDGTAQLFVSSWSAEARQVLAFDLLVLAYAASRSRETFNLLCGCAAIGSLLGLAASWVLVDHLHLALPAGLQVWRACWIAHWFAMASLATFWYRDLRMKAWPRALLLMLALVLARNQLGIAWALLLALYIAWPVLMRSTSAARFERLLGMLFGLGIATVFASYLSLEWARFGMAHHRLDLYAFDRRVFVFPLVPLGLAWLTMAAWLRSSRPARAAMLVFGLLAIGFAAARWDARSPVIAAVEDAALRPDIFGIRLPEDAQVYWAQHGLIGAWMVLQRASYFSPHQIAGQVFNRDLAFDGDRRLQRVLPLIQDDMACQDRSRPIEQRAHCVIGTPALRQACEGAGGPSVLVLPYEQPQAAAGTWTIPDPGTGEPAITWRLYSCASLLQQLAVPDSSSRTPAAST